MIASKICDDELAHRLTMTNVIERRLRALIQNEPDTSVRQNVLCLLKQRDAKDLLVALLCDIFLCS